jgi:signal transduction histidine kinase/ActR/RegA family two-component response regulator
MAHSPALSRDASEVRLLERLDLREGAREAPFDRLARLAALATQSPMAAIVLAGRNGPWLKAIYGLSPPADALLSFPALNSGRSIELADVLEAGHLRSNGLVVGNAAVRFYAAHPISFAGVAVGTLCVLDRVPRRLDDTQQAVLKEIGGFLSELVRSRERQRMTPLERRGAQEVARVSGDWVWETDAEHRYTWLSDNFEAARGRSPQDFLGRPVPDLPILDRLGRPLAPPGRLRDLFDAHRPFSAVVLQVESRRGQRFISFNGVPRFDDGEAFLGFRGTGRDITHRVRAELRAHEKALILRKLADEVPGMLFQFQRRADGRAILPYASPGIRSVLELRASDLVKDASKLLQRVHPDDLPQMVASLEESARTQQPWRAEYRVVLPKAGVRWLDGRASAEQLADGSVVWHGFVADITDRRETQTHLAAALARWELAAEVAGIGIVDVDLDAQVVELDPRAARLHGLGESAARLGLAAWLETVAAEDRHSMHLALGAVASTGNGAVVRYHAAHDTQQLTLETALRLAQPGDGPPASGRVIGTCHDATQRQRLEEAERDKIAAQRANESKSQFLSRVSHELRTPLNAILGFGQLLRMDDSNERPAADRERIEAIRVAGERLLALINDMLDLAQIEQGRLQLEPRPLDAHAAVHAAQLMLGPSAAERGITIQNMVPAGLVQVLADERALGQVLLNIMSNAVKYNRAEGQVSVGAEVGDTVVLSIVDTGPGLTPEQMKSLFEPFNRLGAERTTTVGSGLGLVIAKALVEAMGGSLGVSSEVGQGTTVRLTLPTAVRLLEPDAAAPALLEDTDELLPPACPRTVLYVEDDPVNMVLVQHLFAEEPAWLLLAAETAGEGLAIARRERPDLIVSDMNLPDMSGFELLEQIKADPATADIPCVGLSADAMAEQVRRALDAGFVDYWTKPVDVQAMHRRLRRMLAEDSED